MDNRLLIVIVLGLAIIAFVFGAMMPGTAEKDYKEESLRLMSILTTVVFPSDIEDINSPLDEEKLTRLNGGRMQEYVDMPGFDFYIEVVEDNGGRWWFGNASPLKGREGYGTLVDIKKMNGGTSKATLVVQIWKSR